MARGQRRKCKCCRRLFCPDPRNRRHQRYCSKPRCRAASKIASQARWLAQPENHDYFRGPVHLARNQAWRARHPGYWRKSPRPDTAPKDVSMTQPIGSIDKTGIFVRSPLQDLLTAQPAVEHVSAEKTMTRPRSFKVSHTGLPVGEAAMLGQKRSDLFHPTDNFISLRADHDGFRGEAGAHITVATVGRKDRHAWSVR